MTNSKERMNGSVEQINLERQKMAEKSRQARTQCKKIEDLYHQMLNTGAEDKEARDGLVHELLELQKEDGSFSVIDDYNCDSDIRVDYIYFPTYYATAALIYTMNMDGRREDLAHALAKGLKVACERRLAGHGFMATKQQIEALGIYKESRIYDFLKTYGEEYPDFRQAIHLVIEGYRKALAEGKTFSDWARDFKNEFEKEVEDHDKYMLEYVWYACYGSNINQERFMKYINRCSNTNAPAKAKPYTFPYNLYFSASSRIWEGKAVAFLDDRYAGKALGKMYLITYEQFSQIQQFEGPGYSRKLMLGYEEDLPIYTFTAPVIHTEDKAPSVKYLNVILDGLKETYPGLSDTTLRSYLLDSGVVNDDERKILSYIISSPHGVSLKAIAENAVPVTRARKAIKKLVTIGVLRQDSRSKEAGHKMSSYEAVFYTTKECRDAITNLLIMYR